MSRVGVITIAVLVSAYAAASHAASPWCNGSGLGENPQDPHQRACPGKCEPERNGGAGTCQMSPCYAANGAYTNLEVDLVVSTASQPITVARSLLSSRYADAVAGVGISSSLIVRVHYGTYLFAAPATYRGVADVVMPSGAESRFNENANGTFTAAGQRKDLLVKNPDGTWDLTLEQSRAVYHFSSNGNLAEMRDEFGNSIAYTYDGQGRLIQIADGSGSGRYLDVYYGANGHISSVQDSAGRQVQYTYNTNGSLASVSDPAGRVTNYTYVTGRMNAPMLTRVTDHWGRVVTDVTYDSSDRVATYTDHGETYTLTYRYQGFLDKTAKTDSSGNVYSATYGTDMQVTARSYPYGGTTTAYTAEGYIQQVTDEVGVKTTYGYGADGSVASVTRNDQSSPSVRWDYSYSPDYPGKVLLVTAKNPATGAVDPTWQSSAYDYYGTGSTAPGALHHVYRVKSDGTQEVVATYEYDAQGRVTRQTSATGGVTDYAYTGGNLTSVTAPANNDGGTRPITSYGHDGLGRVTSVTDPLGFTTSYTYDALGRVLTVTLPKPTPSSSLNFTTTYSYDNYDATTGLVFTHVTDPNGKLTKLGYDQFGRLRRSVDASNNTTVYTYVKDLLTSISDANNNVTSYQYDTRKRLSRTTFPDGAYETYTYHWDGLLNTKVDRVGRTITYAYDGLKRLTLKSYSTWGTIIYTYQGQKLTQVYDTTVSPTETHTLTYDSSYRVASNSQGGRGTIDYTYTNADQVASAAVQSGATATYDYYPDGSVDTIEWSPVSGAFKYAYTLRGQYSSVTFPNGQVRAYSYDDQGRLTQLANSLGSTNLATYAYGYDLNHATGQNTMLGQRVTLTSSVPSQSLTGAVTKYYYDSTYQLTRVDYPSAAPFAGEVDTWTYDGIGNRLTETVNGSSLTYSFFKNGSNPLNGQRLQNVGTDAYGYDAAGNMTSRTGYAFGYDIEQRITSISTGLTASMKYDFQGRRSSKTVTGASDSYLYDGVNVLNDVSGSSTSAFITGPGIDEPLAMYKDGQVYYFDIDSLGSVTATNDPSGDVTHSALFDAWGNTRAETGTRNHPFTYTGREVGEAGLLFYRARYYDPSIGRFTQEDPIGYRAEQASLYAYVGGDPVATTDPTGLRYSYCRELPDREQTLEVGEEVERITIPLVPNSYVSIHPITRRRCYYRCYCNNPNICWIIPCRNNRCYKDHGNEEQLIQMSKSRTMPAPRCSEGLREVQLNRGDCENR